MISNEIVKHIFGYFGVLESRSLFTILDDSYKLNKEFSIELEDGEVIRKNIWGVSGKVGNSTIKALLADVTVDNDTPEYVLVFQMDDLSVYALKLERSDDAINRAFVAHEESAWVELSTLMLAKLLVGIEQLNEIFIKYEQLNAYQDLYKYLISFLNYEENQFSQ